MTTKTLGERLFGTLAHEATAKDWERACIILERDRAELIEALEDLISINDRIVAEMKHHLDHQDSADDARALLSRLGADK